MESTISAARDVALRVRRDATRSTRAPELRRGCIGSQARFGPVRRGCAGEPALTEAERQKGIAEMSEKFRALGGEVYVAEE